MYNSHRLHPLNQCKYFTLSPCTVESHPTPSDNRGSSSPSRSIPGILSHVADGGSARIPLECVQPSRARSSSLSRSLHSPEHHVIFHPSCCHPWRQCPLRFDGLDDRYVGLSLHPRYSQNSSPTPLLESVDLPSLRFPHCPSLRSVQYNREHQNFHVSPSSPALLLCPSTLVLVLPLRLFPLLYFFALPSRIVRPR